MTSAAASAGTRAGDLRHDNNFDAIRIAAALAVLVSHQFALTAQPEPGLGLYSWGITAVLVFFTISGYLVTVSWYRDPSVVRFSVRRLLRIWPALALVVAVTVFVLGPWVTMLAPADYFRSAATFDYLLTALFRVRYELPGVFEGNPYAHVVNGSLWTIPVEVRCYTVLALAGLVGLMRRKAACGLAIAVLMGWLLLAGGPEAAGKVHYNRWLALFFLAGSALCLLQPYWQRRPGRWLAALAVIAVFVWIGGRPYLASLIILPFAVICFGMRSTPLLRRAGRWGDPSYGIYVIAFPVQQTVIHFLWPQLGFWPTLSVAVAATVALAYASWHAVEKVALRFKPKRRRRRDATQGRLAPASLQAGGAAHDSGGLVQAAEHDR